MPELDQQHKFELIAKLLACPKLASREGRSSIIGQLPAEISTKIALGAISTPKDEVLAIVDACMAVEQGIAELTSVLSFFDGGTTPFEAVQIYVDTLGFGGLLPFNSNLLPARNPKFTGREKELASLHNTLQDTNMVAVTALHGLGGVGKTSLAIEYIYRHQKAYNLIVWLPAENRLTMELEFIGLLSVLGLPGMPTDTEEARAAAVGAVKKELGRRGKGWLLVFDNAEKPEDVAAFRPGGAAGHVIVTSRNIQMGKLGRAVEVDVLTEGDALRLLAVYACPGGEYGQASEQLWRDAAEKEAAERLVTELGYLALAITQAGAYIQATGCGVVGYLARFKQVALKLFGATGAKPLDLDYKATVATTWQVSFEAVEMKSPAAADLLRLIAFFAPEGIKLAWFTAASVDEEVRASLPERLADVVTDGLELDEMLASLLEYSLVTRYGQGEQLSVHRLVQLVTREKLTHLQLPVAVVAKATGIELEPAQPALEPIVTVNGFTWWLNRAVAFLVASFPNETEYRNWAECDTLVSHLQTLIDLYNLSYPDSDSDSDTKHGRGKVTASTMLPLLPAGSGKGLDLAHIERLFARTATYYYVRVFYTQARPLFERAVAIGEKTLGSDHPDFATTINNLAGLLFVTGDYQAARPLYEHALAITEKALGANHPSLATSLNNLAVLLQTTGDYAAAKLLFEQTIEITEKALGSDHPDLGKALNNLANLLKDTGDYQAARPLYERDLAITEKALGADHPDVAITLNNLANLLKDIEDYAAAKYLYERAIAITEKTLGSDHPDLASYLNNLAGLFLANGDYQAARPLCEQAIAITEKTLGSDHPALATRLNNLAWLLQDTGDYQAARPIFERAIAITEKTLGSDHPDLGKALNNLAWLLQATGDYTEAKRFYERALSITEKVLGADHPDFATTLNNLANLLKAAEDYAAAKPLFERAIAITEKTLGSDHPDLGKALNNLAWLLQATGDYTEAKRFYERALAIKEKALGGNHPSVAITLYNLAKLHEDTSEPDQALPLYKKALAIEETKLGAAQPSDSKTARAVARLESEIIGS